VLAVGILAVSTAGTLVRLLPETHPLVVAFWRVLLVTVVLLPGLQRVSARNVVLSCVGGLFLALHFWTWFASLHLTSVMRSTLLVCLTPIWAGLIEWIILRSPPARHFWAGIGIALVGVAVMVVPGVDGGASSMLGDGLAVLGGILGAAYFTMGRVVRATVAIRSYGPLSCGATAMWLAMLAFATDVPIFSVEGAAWWPILGLAFGPQLLGHVGFNYAVGRLPAATVAGVILLEPVGATAVAAFALGEIPSTFSLLGGLITLIGVAFAVLPRGLARQPRLGGA
jgi:drug/metabolite transporter (DMT)-like permease